jgi:hypothetical protein
MRDYALREGVGRQFLFIIYKVRLESQYNAAARLAKVLAALKMKIQVESIVFSRVARASQWLSTPALSPPRVAGLEIRRRFSLQLLTWNGRAESNLVHNFDGPYLEIPLCSAVLFAGPEESTAKMIDDLYSYVPFVTTSE